LALVLLTKTASETSVEICSDNIGQIQISNE